MINLDKIVGNISKEIEQSMAPMLDRLDKIIDLLEEINASEGVLK